MDTETRTEQAEIEPDLETAPPDGEEVEQEIGELTRDLATEKPAEAPKVEPEAKPSLMQSWAVAIVALLISGAMTVMNVAGLGPYRRGPAPESPAETQRIHELELLALVGYIEDYREDRGHLPRDLGVLELDLAGATAEYEVISETDFVVAVSKGQIRRTFDSRLEPSEDGATG